MPKTGRYAPIIARVLLGLVLVVTGLNKLFWFFPMPPMSQALTIFMNSLKATGYFLPFLESWSSLVVRSSCSTCLYRWRSF